MYTSEINSLVGDYVANADSTLTLLEDRSGVLERLCLGKTDAEIRRRGQNDDKNATRRCCDRLFLSLDAGRELCFTNKLTRNYIPDKLLQYYRGRSVVNRC